MTNIIKFNPVSKLAERVVPQPKPARFYLPDWYKNIKPFNSEKPVFNSNGRPDRSLKMCVPFLDSMSSGYIQESWQDIQIEIKEENNESKLVYYYPTEPKILSLRSSARHLTVDNSLYPADFVWHPQWIPQLPKGYSALYISPLNRYDLPFYTLSGIVDSDTFIQSENDSNIPFLLKSGFTGLIKKGTPLYQIIPIKRDAWKTQLNEFNEEQSIIETHKMRQLFWGAYKKIHWVKKEYN